MNRRFWLGLGLLCCLPVLAWSQSSEEANGADGAEDEAGATVESPPPPTPLPGPMPDAPPVEAQATQEEPQETETGSEPETPPEAPEPGEGDGGEVIPAQPVDEEPVQIPVVEATEEDSDPEAFVAEKVDVKPRQPGVQTYKQLVDSGTVLACVGGAIFGAAIATSSMHMKASGASPKAQQVAYIPFGGPIAAEIYDEEETEIAVSERYREQAVGHMIFELSAFVVAVIGLENIREGKWHKNNTIPKLRRELGLEPQWSFAPTRGGATASFGFRF